MTWLGTSGERMGLERKTTAYQGKVEATGRLHLDSKTLTFTSKEFKWAVELGATVQATTSGAMLRVSKGREKIRFEIGEEGEKWVRKILNPPSRLDKLGVKDGMLCWLSSGFDRGFREELRAGGAKLTTKLARCELAFVFVADRDELGKMLSAAEELPPKVNLWGVWPKGSSSITQGDVMSAAKKMGMGPSKTAAFDEGLSSMRFAKKVG